MDFITTFLKNPITIAAICGLATGLVLSLIVLVKTRIYRKELEDEISDTRYDYRRLEEQMNTQMRVSAKAQDDLQAQIEERNQQILNLQSTIETLGSKAGKKELRTLRLYERTLEIMEEDGPNSLLAWENAKTKATEDLGDIDKGLKPMFRKVFKSEG